MFEKLLSSFSIGTAKVDTRLEKTSYMPGDQIRGQTFVFGGEAPQKINDIFVRIETTYRYRTSKQTHTMDAVLSIHKVTSAFLVQPRETKVFPFTIISPLHTPLTMFQHKVFLRTRLNIDKAIDSKDVDLIEIRPLALMEKVFYGIEYLGFYIVSSECDYDTELARGCEFIQRIGFAPSNNCRYLGRIDKVYIIFLFNPPYHLDIVLDIDERVDSFFRELTGSDRTKIGFQVSGADSQKPVEYFAGLITNAINTVVNANQK